MKWEVWGPLLREMPHSESLMFHLFHPDIAFLVLVLKIPWGGGILRTPPSEGSCVTLSDAGVSASASRCFAGISRCLCNSLSFRRDVQLLDNDATPCHLRAMQVTLF